MLRGSAVAALAGAAALAPYAQASAGDRRRPPEKKPNIIVLSFDDLGWNALGCYGNEFHETPHIDRLAERGLRFTQSYAAAPACSPSRAALMTGLFPARTGITNFLRDEPASSNLYLKPKFKTIPEQLAKRGYRSGLIGKWHLTEDYSGPYRQRDGNPYAHGFDDVQLSEEKYIGWVDWFYPYRFMPSVRGGTSREYLTDRISRDIDRYVKKHSDDPFFLYVSNYAIHYKWKARESLVRKYRRKKRRNPEFHHNGCKPEIAAMIERLDRQVGHLVRALEDAGIADNTLLLITSDNGGAVNRMNNPLTGDKGSLYEGGIRVPMIAYWPGTVAPGTTDEVVSTVDILPTAKRLAEAGGVSGFDGVSLTGVLAGERLPDRDLFWYYPHHLSGSVPSAAVRSGRYKLIKKLRTGRIELYDIEADPRERDNLARSERDVARQLHRKLKRHLAEVRRVAPAPSARNFPRREVTGDPGSEHDLVTIAGTAHAEVIGGRLVASARTPASLLMRSRRGVQQDDFGFALDPGFAPEPGQRPAPRRSVDPVIGMGLAKDAANYLRVGYDHQRRTVDWDLVVDGVSRKIEPEPLTALEGTVDLSAADARLGLSVRDGTVGVYADQGRGDDWEFLFLIDIGGVIDLSDPAVREEWRYAVGVDLASGEHALGEYVVRGA